MTFCECGARLDGQRENGRLCPACLFRLALDSSSSSAEEIDPAHDVQLIGPLGEGPRSVVYLGLHTREHRTLVTVKLIQQPLAADRFRERVSEFARQLQAISTQGFQALIGAGVTSDAQVYVIARYVPGLAITDYVASRRHSALDRVRLAGEVCALVEALHERNIVHGSIKPRNVLVTEGRTGAVPVLLDVGVASAIEDARADHGRTHPTSRAVAITRDISALKHLVTKLLDQPLTTMLDDVRSAAAMVRLLRR